VLEVGATDGHDHLLVELVADGLTVEPNHLPGREATNHLAVWAAWNVVRVGGDRALAVQGAVRGEFIDGEVALRVQAVVRLTRERCMRCLAHHEVFEGVVAAHDGKPRRADFPFQLLIYGKSAHMLLDMSEPKHSRTLGATRLRKYINTNHPSIRDFSVKHGFKYNSVRDWIADRTKPGVVPAVHLSKATAGWVTPEHWATPLGQVD